MYKTPPTNAPVIIGQANRRHRQGRPRITRRKGLKEGDLVLSSTTSCAANANGAQRRIRHCEATDWRKSRRHSLRLTSAEEAPYLERLRQYVYLPWNAVVRRVPPGVSGGLARLVTPMANGVEWSCTTAASGIMDGLIKGPGNRDSRRP